MNTQTIDRQYHEMLVENLRSLIPLGVVFVTGFSYIDFLMNSENSLILYFLIRLISCLPMILFFLLHERLSSHIRTVSIFAFSSVVLGASISSFLIGGLNSDYYIAILIISFIQLSFMPLAMKFTIALEIIYFLLFFPLNIIPFDLENSLVLKQMVNYLSFSTLKIAASKRARKLLEMSFNNARLENELKTKEKIQEIFGELCHLINNPLFISQSLTKRTLKQHELDKDAVSDLENSYDAQKRIELVVKRLTHLYDNREINLAEYQDLLEKTKEEIKNFKNIS